MPILEKVFITDDEKAYLDLIIKEQAASSLTGSDTNLLNAVQWCITMCQRVEKMYGTGVFEEGKDIRKAS